MIATNRLTEEQFLACFAEPMTDVTSDSEAFVNIWTYVDAIDLRSFGIDRTLDVSKVYRDANNAYDQVLIETDKFNSLLVIVVDIRARTIFGYYVLDLNEKYGLS
jgi:hypothetical protein